MRWTRRRFLAAAAATPLVGAACSAPDGGSSAPVGAIDPAGPGVHAYGDDPAQVAELRLPDGTGPHPVVVLLHGGFWRSSYDRTLMEPLAADLVPRGWAAWNLEYRRVGQTGGGWPGTFDDVAAAIDHLQVLVDAGAPLDLARVVAVGHSAGGHLALWSAGRHRLPAGAAGAEPVVALAAAVSQSGVSDLVAAADGRVGGRAVPDLLGGTPAAVPDRYATCSPVALVPVGVPTLCVHGRRDDIVPIDQSERWVAAATDAGDSAELVPFDGGHFEVLDPTHQSWQVVVERLDVLAPLAG